MRADARFAYYGSPFDHDPAVWGSARQTPAAQAMFAGLYRGGDGLPPDAYAAGGLMGGRPAYRCIGLAGVGVLAGDDDDEKRSAAGLSRTMLEQRVQTWGQARDVLLDTYNGLPKPARSRPIGKAIIKLYNEVTEKIGVSKSGQDRGVIAADLADPDERLPSQMRERIYSALLTELPAKGSETEKRAFKKAAEDAAKKVGAADEPPGFDWLSLVKWSVVGIAIVAGAYALGPFFRGAGARVARVGAR